jgi:hypothetical protein
MARVSSPGDRIKETPVAYTTSDGKIFTDYQKAFQHQLEHDFREWCESEFCGGEWSADMMAQAVLENWTVHPKG